LIFILDEETFEVKTDKTLNVKWWRTMARGGDVRGGAGKGREDGEGSHEGERETHGEGRE
jgi:hypothetical protein